MLRSGQLYKVIYTDSKFDRDYIIFSPSKDLSLFKMSRNKFERNIETLFHINLAGLVNVHGYMGFSRFKKVEKPSKEDIVEVNEKIKEFNRRGGSHIFYNEKTNSIKICI